MVATMVNNGNTKCDRSPREGDTESSGVEPH